MKKLFKQLKYIKMYDLFSVFIFIFAFIISLFYKIYLKVCKKNIWLVCEEGKRARDNGYHFFKNGRENYP